MQVVFSQGLHKLSGLQAELAELEPNLAAKAAGLSSPYEPSSDSDSETSGAKVVAKGKGGGKGKGDDGKGSGGGAAAGSDAPAAAFYKDAPTEDLAEVEVSLTGDFQHCFGRLSA